MSVEQKLVDRVTSDAAVQAVIGDRFHALIIPQDGASPSARFARIDTGRFHNMGRDADVERIEIQIDCWASTFALARAGIEAIRNRLDRWRDPAAGIQECLLRAQLDDYEDDRERYRMQQDITIYALQGA